MQNKHQFTREVYIISKLKERRFFGLNDGHKLKFKKPIYGITDAGDYWYVTIQDRMKDELKLDPIVGGPALYKKMKG